MTAVIIQARMGSTRLPGKVMMDLEGKTVLARVVERVQCTNYANDICVATTTLSEDDKIVSEAIDLGVKFYRGSENDVLDRYCEAAKYMKADHIIRVTADNPLTEPRFIDACGMKIVNEQLDYVTSWDVPYGSNSEAISLKALQKSTQFANCEEKEHVTLFIRKTPTLFKNSEFQVPEELNRSDVRITLDTAEDYEFLKVIFKKFKGIPTGKIAMEKVIALADDIKEKR